MARKEETSGPFPDLFLDAEAARKLLEAPAGAPLRLSLDLNLGEEEVEIVPGAFRCRGRELPLAPLATIAAHPRKVFRLAVEGGSDSGNGSEPPPAAEWEPLAVFADGYHQLVPTAGAPTVEIGGIQMHRTAGIDPFAAAGAMAAACVRPGDRVLDTCGGLGYTAIGAARLGAAEVLSVEASAGVLHLRRRNPWSRLADGLPIRLVEGDVFAAVAPLGAHSFDSVIHDPPRFSRARELYSDAFYVRLHDLLKPGGRLFHYTGAPYSRGRGRDFAGEVARRLRDAGFEVEARPDLQGLVGLRRETRARERQAPAWPGGHR